MRQDSAMHAPSQIAAASSNVMVAGMCATRRALSTHDELGVRAVRPDAEDAVADRELADLRTDLLDLAGELPAERPPLRSANAR